MRNRDQIHDQTNIPNGGHLAIVISFFVILWIIPSPAITQTFVKHYVEHNFSGIHKIKVFDLDQDGDYDIIGGSEHTPYSTSKGIAWWRNDGGSPIRWTKFQISTTFLHVMSVDVGDIDNDSLPDVITSSWENGKISWFKNSGDPRFNWREQIVVSGWINAHDAVLSDLNNDGKTEIIGVSTGSNKISIFSNTSDAIPVWSEHVLTNTFSSAKSVSLADLNNDSEIDIIGSADGANEIIWWDNNGGSWNENYVTDNFYGCHLTCITDMNYDGQLDIIGTSWEDNTIALWICENIHMNRWRKTTVTSNLSIATYGIGCDIDQDGDIDVVANSKIPGKLVIYYNDAFTFTESNLNASFNGASALAVIDIDQDGDDDIIAGAGIGGDLLFYENTIITNVTDMVTNEVFLKTYPNPFSVSTTLSYHLPQNQKVIVKIVSLLGQEVTTLVSKEQPCGEHEITWDRTDQLGRLVDPGVYLAMIQTDGVKSSIPMVVSK